MDTFHYKKKALFSGDAKSGQIEIKVQRKVSI
jgi:hypothetical protein